MSKIFQKFDIFFKKNCQKIVIFFNKKKLPLAWPFLSIFLKKCQVFGNFLTFKCQFVRRVRIWCRVVHLSGLWSGLKLGRILHKFNTFLMSQNVLKTHLKRVPGLSQLGRIWQNLGSNQRSHVYMARPERQKSKQISHVYMARPKRQKSKGLHWIHYENMKQQIIVT